MSMDESKRNRIKRYGRPRFIWATEAPKYVAAKYNRTFDYRNEPDQRWLATKAANREI